MLFCNAKFFLFISFNLWLVSKSCQLIFLEDEDEEISKWGVNGGLPCMICTFIIGIVEQLSILYDVEISTALEKYCYLFPPGLFREACEKGVSAYGPVIINGFYAKKTPDTICHVMKFCRNEPGLPECHLFPLPRKINLGSTVVGSIQHEVDELKKLLQYKNLKLPHTESEICKNFFLKEICEYLIRIFWSQKPVFDLDKDGFSTFRTFRGTSWKGRDCNDLSRNIRPGFKAGRDLTKDSNCNGIYGREFNMTQSYEEKFCQHSEQMGVAILGDSVGARFSVPEHWIDATKINEADFQNFIFILENEFDWPQLSTVTGFMNSTWGTILEETRSIYLYLLERNRCNFRDYQNAAMNGAKSKHLLKLAKTLSRIQSEDQPMLVVLSMLGNDVCNRFQNTFDHMTKPDEFHDNIVNALTYLDTILPMGSHVLLTGLANASFLYETMGPQIYPLGRTKNDVTFKDYFDYINCLQVCLCVGWINNNETMRTMADEYALKLSNIARNIAEAHKFKNFDMHYLDAPEEAVFRKWESMGGERWQLIEQFDGFHLNQLGTALAADIAWQELLSEKPHWLGPVNPYNQEITKMFGNQGGY